MPESLTIHSRDRIRTRVAVIVTEFPKTTETFIMRDVISFDLLGYEVRVYPLTPFRKGELVHEFARPTLAWVRNFPYFSSDVLNSVLRWLRAKPLVFGALIRDIFWE